MSQVMKHGCMVITLIPKHNLNNGWGIIIETKKKCMPKVFKWKIQFTASLYEMVSFTLSLILHGVYELHITNRVLFENNAVFKRVKIETWSVANKIQMPCQYDFPCTWCYLLKVLSQLAYSKYYSKPYIKW